MKKLALVLVLFVTGGCTHPEPTRYQVFGINKFRQIRNEPRQYVGGIYAFAGRVVNAEQTRRNVSFQLLVQDRIAGIGDRLPSDGPLVFVIK